MMEILSGAVVGLRYLNRPEARIDDRLLRQNCYARARLPAVSGVRRHGKPRRFKSLRKPHAITVLITGYAINRHIIDMHANRERLDNEAKIHINPSTMKFHVQAHAWPSEP